MSEQTIVADGVALQVRVDGLTSGPPLVLINPASSNLGVYTPLMGRLVNAFRVIRYDWRGTGKSAGGARADYNFARYADDLAVILDQLEVAPAIICGSAYGARTAARFAIAYPQRTALLALFDVSLDHPVDQARQAELREQARKMRDSAGIASPKLDRSWFAHADQKEAMRSLTAHARFDDPTAEMAGVEIPTLVACGRQDENLSEAQRIADLMPNAEMHTMEMTSHPAIMSRPDLLGDLLLDFIKRRADRGSGSNPQETNARPSAT